MGTITPIAAPNVLSNAARKIKDADRAELLRIHDQYKSLSNEAIRRLVIERDRIDILATEVLGYSVTPMHLAIMRWQFIHRDNLQLVFRGAGKSTVATITKTIHLLCKDRDLRILLASKTKGNAEGFLKEIKGQLEGNARLIEIFGAFYDPHRVTKWDNSEIEILGRKRASKEASVTTVGVDSAVVSKHYDVIISDDLVDEDNARTEYMREKVKKWYYQTLDPTLMPPDPSRAHVGEHHRLGTRYHFADLYGHLMENELKHRHQIIPALSPEGLSPWPERYPPAWFEEKKIRSGTIIFNAQYQCDTEAMKGEIFQYDHCKQLNEDEWPNEKELKIFTGVDLAIKAEEKNDQFAIVTIGCRGKVMAGIKSDFEIFVLDYYAAHLRFPQQTPRILSEYDRKDPIQLGVEANAYQLAQYQTLKEQRPHGRFLPIITDKDKISRAWKLAALFEAGRVHFKKGLHGPLIDQLVLFPSYQYKDLFDALDIAVETARRRGNRRERAEPGLM
jgi:phage terminase large subunit-like protein